MKQAGILVASVAAASSFAFAASPHRRAEPSSSPNEGSRASGKEAGSRRGVEEKFAPKFDGLRFIETLVTAHR